VKSRIFKNEARLDLPPTVSNLPISPLESHGKHHLSLQIQVAAAKTSRKATVDLAISILTSSDLGLGMQAKVHVFVPWF